MGTIQLEIRGNVACLRLSFCEIQSNETAQQEELLLSPRRAE